MKEKNIKTYGLIIGIVLFLVLIAGLSYAWYAGQAVNNATIQGEIGMCFETNHAKGEDISGDDLLLIKKDNYISNNQITIGNGMVVTSLTAGIDNVTCPDAYGYMDVYMKDTTVNSAFLSGNSAGALKYVIASYDPNTYYTTTVSELIGETFDIIKEGTVDTASDKLIFTDPMLPRGSMVGYLIIFYLDGDMTFNDGGNTNFSTTISAIASPSIDGSARSYISNLSTPTGTVTNNSIVYNVNTTNKVIVDTLGNARFYGATPNNYIYFNCDTYPDTNCELWRIIGVIDDKVKLIRNANIGSFPHDVSAATVNSGRGIGQWGESQYNDETPYYGADLMKLLNPGYEGNEDLDANGNTITISNSLYYNRQSGTCYSAESYATKSCDFTSNGLKSNSTKNKIAVATYYTGGYTSVGLYTNTMLNKERGSAVLTNPSDGVVRTTSWNGRVAVASPSDYGYAADMSLCVNRALNAYNNATCTPNNWMFSIGKYSRLLFFSSTASGSLAEVANSGAVGTSNSSNGRYILPVLYLNETEVIVGGLGTQEDPYLLSA